MPALVAALLQQGLGLIGNAVLAKGKEVIEQKLGVDLEQSVKTEAGLLELKKLEFSHQEFLIAAAQKAAETELEADRIAVDNVKNARDMNKGIQESATASWLAKNAAYILDFVIVGSTIILAGLLYFKAVPDDNQNLVYLALGSLITLTGTVINFHRGSSSLSKGKDNALEAMASMKDRRAQ